MLTLARCGTPVCLCTCAFVGLTSVPYHTLRRCCEASLSEMCEVLSEALLKGFKIHRSEEKMQWAFEDPVPWCPWVKIRFVSPTELNFIVLFLLTMI